MTHKPYDEMDDGEFLAAVRDYIKTRWMKNGLASDDGKVCLLGAGRLVVAGTATRVLLPTTDAPAHQQNLAQERLARLLAPILIEQYPDRAAPRASEMPGDPAKNLRVVIRFNDHKDTRKTDAIAMIDKAIAHTGG